MHYILIEILHFLANSASEFIRQFEVSLGPKNSVLLVCGTHFLLWINQLTMKGEKMAKRSSFGGLMRKKLSDITNQSQPKLPILKVNQQTRVAHSAEDLINQILTEKATLVKLVEERNKVIELSGIELRNLRINRQKLQLQNWHLAQSNSQLVAEVNLGREKLKALQHELLGKDALLQAKKMDQPEVLMVDKSLRGTNDDIKPPNRSRRRTGRSKSMCPSTANLQLAQKQRAEIKRRRLRRQSESARFKSQERDAEENLFEIEDVKLSAQEAGLRLSSVTKEDNSGPRNEAHASDRSSTGRPSFRRKVEKDQPIKEVPLTVKMHRKE